MFPGISQEAYSGQIHMQQSLKSEQRANENFQGKGSAACYLLAQTLFKATEVIVTNCWPGTQYVNNYGG